MPLELIPELIPIRLERFVELRRSAWLATTMFSPPAPPPTKDVSTMASTVVEPIRGGNIGVEEDPLENEVLSSVRQIPLNNRSNGGSSSSVETDGSGIKWRYATQGPFFTFPFFNKKSCYLIVSKLSSSHADEHQHQERSYKRQAPEIGVM